MPTSDGNWLQYSVVAAVITSVFNIIILFINLFVSARNSRKLEEKKAELLKDNALMIEREKSRLSKASIIFNITRDTLEYFRSNNITVETINIGSIDSDKFTKLCYDTVPNLFIAQNDKLSHLGSFVPKGALDEAEKEASSVRVAMKALADAPQGQEKELAYEMLSAYAKFNDVAEKEIEEIIASQLAI